ncbi:MAG TPA: hypothetical protein VH277_19420 [Gemmatimonadaceae bacterium]|nr:hypothetical protein [Gemmatimonadaceae bacterium]
MNPIQTRAGTDSSEARRVEGRIVRGTRQGQLPVANQWVVLHRVGRDRAGPLDSTRTAAAGTYALRYRTSGDTAALYFVSTSYGGVAYFTSPLRAPDVRGDDARITVFDTTSGPVNVRVGGRHLIVGAPDATGRRPIGEVYDLQNDSTVTVVARDSLTPVWTAHVAAAAAAFQANPNGDLPNGAIVRKGMNVGIFAPLSPGIRQVAFTYELPSNAFPLSVPLETPTGVLEVLVQEPGAHVQGSRLREVAPVDAEGRTFRRFLGSDLQAGAIVRVDVPRIIGREREKVYIGVAVALIAAMAAALMVAARRSFTRTAAPVRAVAESRSQTLVRSIATLDGDYERGAVKDEQAKADYEARRTELKAELTEALAVERRRS